MQGKIDLDQLKRLVADDEIDTIIACFPDMYGRLVGKRVTARFFLDDVAAHGMHACDYLLACDMDMDPVPGYAFTSWAKGYGDFHPIPDFNTLRHRLVARADGSGSLRRLFHKPARARTARTSQHPSHTGRSRSTSRLHRLRRLGARAVRLQGFVRDRREKKYIDVEPIGRAIEDYHILQGTKEEFLIGAIRRIWSDPGSRWSRRRASGAPASRRSDCATPICWKWPTVTRSTNRPRKRSPGNRDTQSRSWPNGMSATPARAATSTQASGATTARRRSSPATKPLARSDVRRRSATFSAAGWRTSVRSSLLRAVSVVVQAIRRRIVRTDRHRLELRQSPGRFPIVGSGPSLHRVPCRRSRRKRLSRLRRHARRRPRRHRQPDRAAADLRRRCLRRGRSAARSAHAERGHRRTRPQSWARETFGEDVIEHYLHFFRTEQRKFDAAVTDWERRRYFEQA